MASIGIVKSLLDRFVTPLREGPWPTEADGALLINTAMLVCPFVFYFFLWHWPYYWCKFSEALGIKPAYLMSYFAHFMKLMQFVVILGAGQAHVPSVIGAPLSLVLPSQFGLRTYELQLDILTIVDLALIGIGQALNSGVFSALGTTGTYYGCRFGETVPWVTGFPYNLGLPDPQYWGSILTLVGLINFFQLYRAPYYVVLNIVCYIFMMWVEASQRTPGYSKDDRGGSRKKR